MPLLFVLQYREILPQNTPTASLLSSTNSTSAKKRTTWHSNFHTKVPNNPEAHEIGDSLVQLRCRCCPLRNPCATSSHTTFQRPAWSLPNRHERTSIARNGSRRTKPIVGVNCRPHHWYTALFHASVPGLSALRKGLHLFSIGGLSLRRFN